MRLSGFYEAAVPARVPQVGDVVCIPISPGVQAECRVVAVQGRANPIAILPDGTHVRGWYGRLKPTATPIDPLGETTWIWEKVSPQEVGLYEKYTVTRVDGRSAPGEKHYLCRYYVLDLTHDPFARRALLAYAEACRTRYPELSRDLHQLASDLLDTPGPD